MRGPTRILAALLLLAAFSACGAPPPPCLRGERFCAALVTSTAGLHDYGLNASAWEGLQQAVQDGTLWQADYIESVDPRDYEKNMAALAALGYDLIITSGAGMREATFQAAAEHPETRFLGLDQPVPEEPLPNLNVMTFPEEQGGFLAGALAAMVSRTGIVGAVCETSGLDPMWRYCEGFRLGALYENKSITVLLAYHEDADSESLFQDEGWGADTAADMLNLGADVIFGAGGRLGQGALRRAAQSGVWSIGAEADQFFLLREARRGLLSSAVPDAREAVREYVRQFNPRIASEGPLVDMQGAMTLAPWHEGEPNIPLSAQTALQALQVSLQNGSLPVNPLPPR